MGDFPIAFGRYQLVERLAVGGMAELFVATSPGEHGFQKKVVIKRLLPQLTKDETFNAMFIDEAKLTARLVHPKIAQTFELGKVDEGLYIAMEYIDGIDVLALLREFAARKRRVDPQLAAWIAHEVLDALDYAHNLDNDDRSHMQIVHRDISPSNVLMSVRGDIKLVDFGIARAKDPDRAHKSKSGTLKGKYGYMSPEQVLELPLDGRSDLFSVGVVLAELLTGRRLFAAPNELDVLLMVRDAKLTRYEKYGAEIDEDLSAIVKKSLRKNLEDRWHSAAEFRDALGEWLFEHRHRMSARHVADIVEELRPAVLERRVRANSAGLQPEELVVSRAPSEDSAAPMVIVENETSMPVIQMSYEQQPADDKPARPITSTDMAAMIVEPEPRKPSVRAETVSGRPKAIEIPPKAPPHVIQIPAAGTKSSPTIKIPPARKPTEPSLPLERPSAIGTSPNVPRPEPVPEPASTGVIDLPNADSISAAVERITIPDEASSPIAALTSVKGPPTDDSAMRAFDDLTYSPDVAKRRELMAQKPTEEEALRKRPPTPPSLADIEEAADDTGDFSTTSPLRVLFRLMTARSTGLLVVAVGGIKKEIYVRDGQPEYVSSNVASELFGNYLVTKGVLSDGELAMALAMMPHYGGKLGDTLVGLGLLKPLEVFRHLTRQVRSKIIDVCTWNKGQFGWYGGRENPREAFPLDFNAFEILGAGAMTLAEEVVEAWVAKQGAVKLRVSRNRRVGPERFEVKGLQELCEQLDGTKSVNAYVEMFNDRNDRLRISRMLCLLEACDLARAS